MNLNGILALMQTIGHTPESISVDQVQEQAEEQYRTYVTLANLGQAATQVARMRPEFYAPLPSQLTLFSA